MTGMTGNVDDHEGDGVDDIERNVVAEIRVVLAAAAPASAAAAQAAEPERGDASGVGLQAWLQAATSATHCDDGEVEGDPAAEPPSAHLTRTPAVIAQEKALQAAMVAHAVAGGAESVAQAAAIEARRAEALLAAVAASARLASLTHHKRRGDADS